MTLSGMWVIGYGLLIFKPPPHVEYQVQGYISGFVRRFWQSSLDHRGTPEHPGRVVTLVSYEDIKNNRQFHDFFGDVATISPSDLKVWGVAYYIAPKNVQEVRQYLDVREQDGYTSHQVPFHITSPCDVEVQDRIVSSIYIGTIDNESFVGPESVEATAAVIRTSVGPSGPNVEYLEKLVAALRELGETDEYLEQLIAVSTRK